MLLFYVFYYLVAAVVIFQGAQVLGEQREPLGVVPEEVGQKPRPARMWGRLLVGMGVLDLLVGILSHPFAWHGTFPLRYLLYTSLLLIGAYGFYVIFLNRKVAYMGKPSAPAHGHHH